jgi:hypothetical protein
MCIKETFKEIIMKRTFQIFLMLIFVPLLLSFNCGETNSKDNKISGNAERKQDSTEKTSGLGTLVKAYPDFLEKGEDNKLYWKDGTVMTYDDGIEKDFEEMLDNPDLEDMFDPQYIAGPDWGEPPAVNSDPGRIRYEPFFSKMYGNSQREVSKNLRTINWFGTSVQVSTVNNVDNKFEAVMEDLEKLPEKFHKYFKKTAGTYNYRKIAGTDRLSTHSYGIAIDINTDYSDYWRWDKSMKYKNRIPYEVAEVFEKHGFIWGAKWYHYDTMHFEYRPELLN